MGRSAKFHKKLKVTSKGSGQQQAAINSVPNLQDQKKRAGLKAKALRRKEGSDGHVLGGADYVQLMMGGRRKAQQEAARLPKDSDA